MKILAALCFWLLLLGGPASAQPIRGGMAIPVASASTITNYNGGGTAAINQVSRYDTDGNKLEISSGNILQVGTCPSCTFYAYGDDYSCGSQYGNSGGAYCGVNVYSTTDLKTFHNLGHLFNPAVPYWQSRCTGSANAGCYRPHAAYNATNNNYVIWINQSSASSTRVADGYIVLTCTTPYSGCGAPTEPSHLAHGPITGDESIFVDPQNKANGYVIYKSLTDNAIYIDALNATFTDSTGATLLTHAPQYQEAPWMFFAQSTYFIAWGPNCALCKGGAYTISESASSPMGTYGNQVVLNSESGSCLGQPRSVDVIAGAGGRTTYLISTDQWNNLGNEGLANIFFAPLSISGGVISPFACPTTITVPGLVPDNTVMPVPSGTYLAWADPSTSTWRMQTFRTSATTLTSIKMPLGQTNLDCTSNPIVSCAGGLDANPVIKIVTLDGNNNPVTTLGSVALARATLSWGQKLTTLTFNLTGLTIGTHYGIVIENHASRGSVTMALYTGSTNPYPSGVERVSTNSGGSFTTQTGYAINFTVVP